MVEHFDDEQNSGLHLTGNTVDSNSDSFTEKEPIALKVVTDKHEVMPEEIWDQSIFSIFPCIKRQLCPSHLPYLNQ